MGCVKRETGQARSVWHTAAQSAGVKFLVLGVSAVLGLVTTRLLITHFGTDTYAQYGLLVAIGALLPFTDLGLGAPIINAVAESDDARCDDHLKMVLVSAIRALLVSMLVVIAVALVVAAVGGWPAVLGDALTEEYGPLAATLCLIFIGLAVPFGIGMRILTGQGRNHVAIAFTGLQSPVVLLTLLILVTTVGSTALVGSLVAVIPYVALLLIAIASTLMGGRLIHPTLSLAVSAARHWRRVRGAHIFDTAGPMMIIMISLPIGMQSDRIVLSHFATISQLAEYNMAAQFFTPIRALISAAGFTLWPIFAKARRSGQEASPLPAAGIFAMCAVTMCLVVSLLSPVLTQLASDGEITVSVPVLLSFSIYVVVQAATYPLGLYLTDASGLRFQALMVLAMIAVNLTMSILLTPTAGAAGPLIGSAVGILVFQLIANLLWIRRRTRAPGPPAEPEASGADAAV